MHFIANLINRGSAGWRMLTIWDEIIESTADGYYGTEELKVILVNGYLMPTKFSCLCNKQSLLIGQNLAIFCWIDNT